MWYSGWETGHGEIGEENGFIKGTNMFWPGVVRKSRTEKMDSMIEHLNMNLEGDQKAQRLLIKFTLIPTHPLSLIHTHVNATCTSTAMCVSLLTQALQVPLTIHAVATSPTRSAAPSLSLRVTTLSLNQTRTTTRTMIKQTSSRSLKRCIFMYNLIGRKQLTSSSLPIRVKWHALPTLQWTSVPQHLSRVFPMQHSNTSSVF